MLNLSLLSLVCAYFSDLVLSKNTSLFDQDNFFLKMAETSEKAKTVARGLK